MEQIQRYITSCVTRNELSHAYLFVGSDQQTDEVVNFFIEQLPNGNANEITRLNRVDASISIDEIRDMLTLLSKKSYGQTYKIVVISSAQRLSTQAGNALLKRLEDSYERTIFILTTTHEQLLLPTIVSRCVTIHLPQVVEKNTEEQKSSSHSLWEQNDVVARLSNVQAYTVQDFTGIEYSLTQLLHRKMEEQAPLDSIVRSYETLLRAYQLVRGNMSEALAMEYIAIS